ncbi:MAG: exodeoxyribonuclease VII large subunit [Chloroflexi bacterium]|nr:exodeoxyribonuclease VII large subunit [Chloroflexota bacterium]
MVSLKAWSVSDLTAYIKGIIQDDALLRDVWLEGEVSNFVRYSSGHCYFSLKDEYATLQCVMWRSVADTLPELPQNGQHILAHGYISVYEARGTYQLYVDFVRSAGVGNLYAQFEALKKKLAEEGLFDEARKRPIPSWPRRIGVVTSPHGAALRDIIRVIRNRFAGVEVILSPTQVQGEDAPRQIVAALEALVRADVDVIVVARGGGSLEDLWAFNDERVARAIARSPIPVVSGVGHETDFTIADFVADLRAPTPSAAAAAIVPDAQELRRRVARLRERLLQLLFGHVARKRQSLETETRALRLKSPQHQIAVARQRIDDMTRAIQQSMQNRLELTRTRVQGLEARLNALNPRQVLDRGYAIVIRSDGQVVTSVNDVAVGEHMWVQLHDGEIESWVVDVKGGEVRSND